MRRLVTEGMAVEICAFPMTGGRVAAIFPAGAIEKPLPVVGKALVPNIFHRKFPKVKAVQVAGCKRARLHVHPLIDVNGKEGALAGVHIIRIDLSATQQCGHKAGVKSDMRRRCARIDPGNKSIQGASWLQAATFGTASPGLEGKKDHGIDILKKVIESSLK